MTTVDLQQAFNSDSVPPDRAVKQALYYSGHFDLRCLEVSAVDGRVRVSGCVRSFYLKQRAQVIAMSVVGRRALLDEILVRSVRNSICRAHEDIIRRSETFPDETR